MLIDSAPPEIVNIPIRCDFDFLRVGVAKYLSALSMSKGNSNLYPFFIIYFGILIILNLDGFKPTLIVIYDMRYARRKTNIIAYYMQ